MRPLRTDQATAQLLKRAGLSWNSIPEAGRPVELASICNYQHGTTYAECLSIAHTDIIDAAERAAAEVEAVVAGVDIIAPDIKGPDYIVNEVNTTPLLLIHYAAPEHLDPIREILTQHFGLAHPSHPVF
jgi:D-alanine-D-alanine ligase-like ATP-grasp enzyme